MGLITNKYPGTIKNVSLTDNVLCIETESNTYTKSSAGFVGGVKKTSGRFQIFMSSPASGVIRVRVKSHTLTNEPIPLSIDTKPSVASIDETEDTLIYKTGMLEAHIAKNSELKITYKYCGNVIATSLPGYGATYSSTEDLEEGIISDGFVKAPDELFYGLGGSGSLCLNGTEAIIDNLSTSAECINVPFFVSSNGYGIFVNTPGVADFSFAKNSAAVSFGVDGEELDYYLFGGSTMGDVLTSYSQVVGSTFMPPVTCLGTSLYINDFTLDADSILAICQSHLDAGINISEVWLGNSWHNKENLTGLSWDANRFADSGVFARKLHDKGILLGVSVNPYISELCPEYKEYIECNYLVKKEDGKPYVFDSDSSYVSIIDVNYMAAKSAYMVRLDALLKSGVDLLEADFSYEMFEQIPELSEDSIWINTFALRFNQLVKEIVIHAKGSDRAAIIATSTAATDNNYPYKNVTIANMSYPTFGDMAATLTNALSHGMSGYSLVNIDVPDIAATNPVLYSRWLQMGFMAPHFRIKSTAKTVPGAISAETSGMLKLFTNMRCGLAPYINSVVSEAARYGIPAIRPMTFEFPSDKLAVKADNQYMFGSSLLVAPVLSETGAVSFYLPAGIWTNMLTREKIQGPRVVSRQEAAGSMPIYVRPNSILATCSQEQGRQGNYADGVVFTAFELKEGQIAACEVALGQNRSGIVNILKQGNKITVKTEGLSHSKSVVLAGVKNVVSVSESMPEVSEFGTTISFTSNELVVTLG